MDKYKKLEEEEDDLGNLWTSTLFLVAAACVMMIMVLMTMIGLTVIIMKELQRTQL